MTLLREIPADIIHIHIGGLLSGRLLALCAICAMLPRRRVVLTFHSGGYPSKVAGNCVRRWSLRSIVFRRLDAIIAVNAEIGALFARLGVSPSESMRFARTLPSRSKRISPSPSPSAASAKLIRRC